MRTPLRCVSSFVFSPFLLVPVGSQAHTFDVPEEVQADPDGTFSYEAVFTVGPGTAFLAFYEWFGTDNVEGGLVADCFCFPQCVVDEGEVIIVEVDGQLTDPEMDGEVETTFALCDEPSFVETTRILSGIVSVDEVPEPLVARLSNLPNPFSSATTFSFSLREEGWVALRLYDVEGRLRAMPVDQWLGTGAHSVDWSSRDRQGKRLSPGVYFARLEVNGTIVARRVTVTN